VPPAHPEMELVEPKIAIVGLSDAIRNQMNGPLYEGSSFGSSMTFLNRNHLNIDGLGTVMTCIQDIDRLSPR
jgi:hypothetical protein